MPGHGFSMLRIESFTSYSALTAHHNAKYNPDMARKPSIKHASTVSSTSSTNSTRSNRSNSGPPAAGVSPSIPYYTSLHVDSAMTHNFVVSSFSSESSQRRLNERVMPLLSEKTYLEWILEKSKKLFMLLVELGQADRIFDIAESSWEDEDMPLDSTSISRLGLNSLSLEKRFYKRQYAFNVRTLSQGSIIDYELDEIVPLDVVRPKGVVTPSLTTSSPVVSQYHTMDKVYNPTCPQSLFTRKRVYLSPDSIHAFHREVRHAMEVTQHPNILTVHSAYTHDSYGYILYGPCTDFTLKQFFNSPPSWWRNLSKAGKQILILEWMLALASACDHLSQHGLTHRDLRPRSIALDGTKIYLVDIGTSRGSTAFPIDQDTSREMESYEYSAPELWLRTIAPTATQTSASHHFDGRTIVSSSSSRRPSSASSTASPPKSSSSPTSPSSSSLVSGKSNVVSLGSWASLPESIHSPGSSDIFSLGCLFLDLLSHLILSPKTRSIPTKQFAAHRSRQHRQRGSRGGGLPDQSFHANLGQVYSWAGQLEKLCRKDGKAGEGELLRVIVGGMVQREVGRRWAGWREVRRGLAKVARMWGMDMDVPDTAAAAAEVLDGVEPVQRYEYDERQQQQQQQQGSIPEEKVLLGGGGGEGGGGGGGVGWMGMPTWGFPDGKEKKVWGM